MADAAVADDEAILRVAREHLEQDERAGDDDEHDRGRPRRELARRGREAELRLALAADDLHIDARLALHALEEDAPVLRIAKCARAARADDVDLHLFCDRGVASEGGEP